MLQPLLFIASLALVYKSADLAIRYSSALARMLHWSSGTIGFLVVALISVLPETFIAILSALEGSPELGVGTLLGSNVADLTLVFAVVVLWAGRGLKVQSSIIHSISWYALVLSVPVLLGLNGAYSRWEGAALIAVGVLFYVHFIKKNTKTVAVTVHFSYATLGLLILSMMGLLVGAHFTVLSALSIAETWKVHPVLIGLLVIGLGTTLPELFFSMKAVKNHHDNLALGDILGTVLTDATLVLGLMALIRPFQFDPRLVYGTGVSMLLAFLLLFFLMKTGKELTRKEAVVLGLFYGLFVVTQLILNQA